MTTSKRDLLAAVPSLNKADQPFEYAVVGDTIVGTWDIVKATSLYPTEVEHVDKSYSITVELDEDKATYDFEERKASTEASAGGDGLSMKKEGFIGKSSSKEFSFSFGGVNKTEEGVSMAPVAYSFETSRIKEPLFGFLEEHGWKRKKGFLGGLFSR